ncbi:pyridoxamine 5'-phosphate oxidase family protein [Undibacterium cyanobacteriorum]|uniref:Pyridoxamine 5'-phosphate oxidase family protein n=1 Tax=Undibacterium cyanobacteriorum TaxID=3073561 RepID=A0ABY9RET0_9BURK|nr:pyridoxamine 5'-phosphate oxidase family protein [Undibacterium sp. 20NA77.5]WMW79694.1 pyridoxamine 5'-phosphate oxidase family protein [Undibacterium sp. 20NA77.5]
MSTDVEPVNQDQENSTTKESTQNQAQSRTQIRRIPKNARTEKEFLYQVIDSAYVCHVAFQDEHGTHCIPTACWREHNHLYIHGANASRMMKQLQKGIQACVTITHIDGIVLARAAFNHSMNYRSAMIYGSFEVVPSEQKAASLAHFLESLVPGRQAQVRAGNFAELAGTTVLRIALDETMCKTRSGGPNDDDEDMDLPVWAGVLPLQLSKGEPVLDPSSKVQTATHVDAWLAS